MKYNDRREFIKKSLIGAAGGVLSTNSLVSWGSAVKSGSEIHSIDLLEDVATWTAFTPQTGVTTRFSKKMGVAKRPLLILNGNNRADSIGCWKRKLPDLQKGRRYRIKSSFWTENMDDFSENIRGIITKNQNEYAELSHLERAGELNWLVGEFESLEENTQLEICLYLLGSGNGTLNWSNVLLEDITDTYEPNYVELASISGRPSNPKTPGEAIDFYCNQLDKITTQNLDLICLGETINIDGVSGSDIGLAESIPGPSTDRLGEKAKKLNTYLVAGVLERLNGETYNTAVLIDRNGKVAGKYHKTHLTIKERFVQGVKPGNDYPVFKTDFGKVGILICYDNHFPEVMRILAVKGADLIAFPNMGDGRVSKGGVWETYMRTRAIDNHIPIVSGVNTPGQSCIVNGGGEILAIDRDKNSGTIVQSKVDLNKSVENFSGKSIQKRYLLLRRPETYSPLLQHNWDFVPDSKF